MMWYKYEIHMHSSQGSKCGRSKCSEMVRAYSEAGYSGAVLTDHFIFGNTAVPRELPWRIRMQAYYDAYLEGRALADELDFDLLFGIEHGYGMAKEILVYNISLAFLQENEDIPVISAEEFARRIHAAGGYIVHAHPYRDKAYCPPNVEPNLGLADAIEVYNFTDDDPPNAAALAAAKAGGFSMTVGADNHYAHAESIGKTAILFPRRIRSSQQFADAMFSKDYRLMKDGEFWEP